MRRLIMIALLASASMLSVAWAQDDKAYEERLKRAQDVIPFIERICLSSYRVSGDASVSASISSIKKIIADGLKGSITAEAATEEVRGAVGFVEEKIRLEENAAIRDCMKSQLERIVDYLLHEEAATEKGECWDITVKHPDRFPYYLKNTESELFKREFYWFRVNIQNDCAGSLRAAVWFEVELPEEHLPSIDYDQTPHYIKVRAGEEKFETLDPEIRILARLRKPFSMKVNWRVTDEKDKLLERDTDRILVLPPDEFVWELKSPEGKPISKEFLLASLAAWGLNDPKAVQVVRKRVKENLYRMDGTPLAVARVWTEGVYKNLFKGKGRIHVWGSASQFPPTPKRSIDAPGIILDESHSSADPIEAALLIHSVMQPTLEDIGIDQMLAIVPDDTKPGHQMTLLAWVDRRSAQWEAIRAGHIGRDEFEKNRTAATAALRNLLDANQAFSKRLQRPRDSTSGGCPGAFMDEASGLYVVDFSLAKACNIGGVPF